ncbi:cytochrome P450 [Mycena olivaceomarginata]|nr:cytochrome P450 [Mycena olivaceomarginata]
MLHAGLSRRAAQAQAWRPAQELQLGVLIRGLAENPEAFAGLIKTCMYLFCSRPGYGTTTRLSDEYTGSSRLRRSRLHMATTSPPTTTIEDGANALTKLTQPFFWIEIFPFLRFLPAWFPLGRFKRVLKANRKMLDDIETVPFEWAKNRIDTGTHSDSFFSQYFLPPDSDEGREGDTQLKWTAGSIYAGGAHTTTSAIASFLLFMSTHPAVQKRAQDEIDAHLGGTGRLLTLEDQKALPYVCALIKEVLRSAPVAVAPLSTPKFVPRIRGFPTNFLCGTNSSFFSSPPPSRLQSEVPTTMPADMPAGPSRRTPSKKSKKGAPLLRPAKAKKLSEKQQKEMLEREAQAYVRGSTSVYHPCSVFQPRWPPRI